MAAPVDVIHRITAYRSLVDLHGDHVLERAVAGLLLDGTLGRHIRRARREYRLRRDALCTALGACCPT